MDSERAARGHYKTKLKDIWYELALDEAVCLAIYAVAYDTDKTARLTHLRRARRSLKIIIPTLEKGKTEKATRDYQENEVLKYGEDIIVEAIKGYSTDNDVLPDEKKGAVDRLNTKRIRGVGKKKQLRQKELEQAASLYAGE